MGEAGVSMAYRPGWRQPLLRLVSFAAGLAALAVAMAGPLAAAAERLFAAHMAQLMLLMDAAAPLLVLGAPAVPHPRLLPAAWAGVAHRLLHPAVAGIAHAAVLWGWHLPGVYRATAAEPALHAPMHATFLIAGLLFWQSVVSSGRTGGFGYGAGVFWTFLTMMHAGLLGALITFAPEPLYGTALSDQQRAGLIMWIPTASIYLVAGLILAAAWLRGIAAGRLPGAE